jgi:hypothetical protein
MVLSTTRRTAAIDSITNRNQGGGNKKAGFPYMVGRDQWSSVFFKAVDPVHGRCCNLNKIGTTLIFTRNTTRPIGSDSRIPMR